MAGYWGYHSYRGRTPRWKYVLAVVLVAVILAAVGFIVLQERVVYDESGIPHLRLPEKQTVEPEQPEETVELTIQEPEKAEAVYVYSVPTGKLTMDAYMTAAASSQFHNACAVTLKDSTGKVWFDSAAAVSGATQAAPDTEEALKRFADAGYDIARLACFHDSRAANSDVEGMGLKNTGGYIFYDGNNSQWLDPAKPAARQYLCRMAAEAAELGFDEILLTDVSYPTQGKLDKIAYGEGDKGANLTAFLEEMRAALEPYSVALSIELPEVVITTGADEDAGLRLAEIAPLVDRIYARTEPERVDTLTAAVAAAGTAEFVPELTAGLPDGKGSYLLLSENAD